MANLFRSGVCDKTLLGFLLATDVPILLVISNFPIDNKLRF